MSQFPSPYLPPNVTPYFGGQPDALKPARRASTMMLVLGPLMILLSGCLIGFTFLFSQLPPEQLKPIREKVEAMAHVSPEFFFRTVGTVVLIAGLTLLILGIFVRRGGMIATTLSLIVVGLIVLQQLLAFVMAIISPMNADGVSNLCGSIITLGIFGLLFSWLIKAARAAPKLKSAQQEYLAQYWQYQQNMQNWASTQPAPQGYATASEPPSPPPVQ